MPPIDQMKQSSNSRLRVLAYGESGTKKTWWLGTAAQAGFNILLLNGDDNADVLYNLPEDAQARIHSINCSDRIEEEVMAPVLTALLSGKRVLWDDDNNRLLYPDASNLPLASKDNLEVGRYLLHLPSLNTNWVLGLDSWTANLSSVLFSYAKQERNKTSVQEYLEEMKGDRDWYFYASTLLDWQLTALRSVPCHSVTIAHGEVWEKFKKDPINPKKEVLDFTRIQPISSSHNHGRKLAKYFMDTMLFTKKGGLIEIDLSNKPNQDSGSRVLAPASYKWGELSFGRLAELHHLAKPAEESASAGCTYYPAGTPIPAAVMPAAQAKPAPLSGQPAKPASVNIFKKGK